MHARDLVELAAVLATQQNQLSSAPLVLSRRSLERYWTDSKCRLDRWHRAIKRYQEQSERAHSKLRTLLWHNFRPVLEEILCTEVLTRVWTAIVCTHDRLHGTGDGEAIVRSVYIGQLEARNRTLNLMVRDQSLGAEDAVMLNRLRRRCESWVDMLLAWLEVGPETEQFSFHPERTHQFAQELAEENRSASLGTRIGLLQASLRASFHHGLSADNPNGDLNREIAATILACFPADLFDSIGQFKSLWQVRLEHGASDTQGLLAEFLAIQPPSEAALIRPRRF